ncbi:MAG: radical SAM peptide maturase, CXXX-repeat target family [Clostridiales bacterium]|nr:radical SAM peptide maturase, CXXX-repeat target family [Clostridiales bacterium]
MKKKNRMENKSQMWIGRGKAIKNITFCVTEDCNLACKYCYMLHKNSRKTMDFNTAKKAVDFFIDRVDEFPEESVVWDFIGGEPFLEIDLIDKICDYIKIQQFRKNHKWFKSYRFSFSTNGMNYTSKRVQEFITKNKKHLSIGISVDGNKIKHDTQRVKLDGSGSYDDVLKAIPLWQEQFPDSPTKATFAHDDLIHLKDSIISLWNIGIKNIAANIVFEDVWEEGDVEIFEEQLIQLADYIIENNMWEDYNVRFFDPHTGYKSTKEELNNNFCGAGQMVTVDTEGKLFTCIRYLDFTLENASGYSIGDLDSGIDYDLLKPFSKLNKINVSDTECNECEVGEGCPYCSGFNYDDCNGDTLFNRTKYHCEMYKANVKVIKYFWKKLESQKGVSNPRKDLHLNKKVLLINDSEQSPHCNFSWKGYNSNKISNNMYSDIVDYCDLNSFDIINIGEPPNRLSDRLTITSKNVGDNIDSLNIIDKKNISNSNIIINIQKSDLLDLRNMCESVLSNGHVERININLLDVILWDNLDLMNYRKGLEELSRYIFEVYDDSNNFEVNILTDSWNTSVDYSCKSGSEHLTITQNGDVYLCPGYVHDDSNRLGNFKQLNEIFDSLNGKNINESCDNCDVIHCKKCSYTCKNIDNNKSDPSNMLCQVSKLEFEFSSKLKDMLKTGEFYDSIN